MKVEPEVVPELPSEGAEQAVSESQHDEQPSPPENLSEKHEETLEESNKIESINSPALAQSALVFEDGLGNPLRRSSVDDQDIYLDELELQVHDFLHVQDSEISNRPKRALDLDGDGDVDCFDMIHGFYLAGATVIASIDHYVVGFPFISSACCVGAFNAMGWEIHGFQVLLENTEQLGKLVGSKISLPPSVDIMLTLSFVLVVCLNLAVVSNGLVTWLRRVKRKGKASQAAKSRQVSVERLDSEKLKSAR